ncbi:hypothetical protein D9M72_502860 [compost metagenome]
MPAFAVHELAGRIEHQHVDRPGEAVDQRGVRGVHAQVVRPERDDHLPGGAQGAEQQNSGTHGEEDAGVGHGNAPHGGLRSAVPVGGSRRGRQVRDGDGQDGGRCHGRNAHPVRAADPGKLHDAGAHERADENADPAHAAQRGQGAGAEGHGHRLGQVFLPCQAEDAGGHPDDDHRRREQPQSVGNHRGQRCRRQRQGTGRGGPDDGPAFAEFEGDQGGRQVEEP